MDDARDVERAWRFINGYRVPHMTAEERAEWTSIIARVSFNDWQRGCRKTMNRPEEQARFRPSPMEFRAYSKGESPPVIPPFPKKEDGPLTARDIAAKDEWLAKCRAALRRERV